MYEPTIIVMIVVPLLLGAYDIYVIAKLGPSASISWIIYNLAQKYPMIPFLLGLLMGHFFWVNKASF